MNEVIKDKIVLSTINPLDLYGPDNKNIHLIKSYFKDLNIVPRGVDIIIEGQKNQVQKFKNYILKIISHISRHETVTSNDLDSLLFDESNVNSSMADLVFFGKNGVQIKPRTLNQRQMIQMALVHNLLFVLGPAGTGKTYMSIALAVKALKEKNIKKIILTRPAVEAGENLGFLPGDLYDKLSPYMRPLYDALHDMLSKEKLNTYLESHQIEIVPLAFMRGRTLDHAFVILDEAQNTTINQMKMFLTRMGGGARFIICGDVSQIDLPANQKSGLIHASEILKSIDGIGFIKFDEKDVIRHALVQSIIKAYKN